MLVISRSSEAVLFNTSGFTCEAKIRVFILPCAVGRANGPVIVHVDLASVLQRQVLSVRAQKVPLRSVGGERVFFGEDQLIVRAVCCDTCSIFSEVFREIGL